ncbi:MAG: hypothetical protein ABSG67_21260 [Thermoguttaceae bacterium]
MIPRISAVFAFVLTIVAGSLGSLAQDKNIEHSQRSTWRITLNLDAPNLAPPALQWAVLDKDPVPGFRARIKMSQGFYQTQLDQAKNEAQKELLRSVQMTVNWDLGFREVTGDQLYLLTGAPGGNSLSSSGLAGKKWIVTKIVRIKEKPVCWCLPVEVKTGEPIKVTLTEDNVFDLGAAMEDALAAEKKTDDKTESKPDGVKESSLIKAMEKALHVDTAASSLDEPAAHALYNQMVEAMRKADSLSYVSHYTWEAKGRVLGDCTYRVWLKKPNYFRVEAESALQNKGDILAWLKNYFRHETQSAPEKRGGILIGDGRTLWIYWLGARPQWGEESEADQKTRLSSYMKKPAPPGGHSIGHEVGYLGAGMSMPIIDPSTFHGYTDSLQPYLDGVKGMGVEKVGDEDCDKIEVSIMKHQRSWFLWLSKTDHLPRKLNEIVRVSYDLIINEEWSAITLNGEIPDTQFAWKPPEGWTQWKMPKALGLSRQSRLALHLEGWMTGLPRGDVSSPRTLFAI